MMRIRVFFIMEQFLIFFIEMTEILVFNELKFLGERY